MGLCLTRTRTRTPTQLAQLPSFPEVRGQVCKYRHTDILSEDGGIRSATQYKSEHKKDTRISQLLIG